MEESIPVIPPEVETVNLTWEAGPDIVRSLPVYRIDEINNCYYLIENYTQFQRDRCSFVAILLYCMYMGKIII